MASLPEQIGLPVRCRYDQTIINEVSMSQSLNEQNGEAKGMFTEIWVSFRKLSSSERVEPQAGTLYIAVSSFRFPYTTMSNSFILHTAKRQN